MDLTLLAFVGLESDWESAVSDHLVDFIGTHVLLYRLLRCFISNRLLGMVLRLTIENLKWNIAVGIRFVLILETSHL